MAGNKAATSLAPNTADREIVLSRVFDAPRELVWDALVDPKQVVQWWGPWGFTTTSYEMDLRPGGVWRHTMHGPDGTNYPNKIVFVEVVKHERIVYSQIGGREDGPAAHCQVIWSFEEEGDKTKLTLRMVFDSPEEREQVNKDLGFVEGGRQTLERLAARLAETPISAALKQFVERTNTVSEQDLIITRIFDAPRELIWNAWTDPKQVAQWWGPKGFTNPVCELDVRPGGAILIHMRGPDGVVYPMTGVYQEVVELERLVFISAALDDQGKPLFEVLTTVTLTDQGKKTKQTMQARVIKRTAKAAPYIAGMEAGWTQSLERLAEFVIKQAREQSS
jgi:uncharacterized protein YndB with AHSA1/START domain